MIPSLCKTKAFASLCNKHVPKNCPGEVYWDDNSLVLVRDSIEQYWIDEPDMIRLWKVALFKALEWVYKLQIEGRISDYLLVSRSIQGEMITRIKIVSTTFPLVHS